MQKTSLTVSGRILRRLVGGSFLLPALPVPGGGQLEGLAGGRAGWRLLGQRVAHVVAAAGVQVIAVPHVVLKMTVDK